jgi:hypothetical protein
VFRHALKPSRRVSIVELDAREAELLYCWHFANVEFFPADIDAVLSNDLSLGTFMALPSGAQWESVEAFLASPPPSWAVLSVWNCMDAFRFEVRGAPRLMRTATGATRLVDRAAPWLGIPSIPNLFAPFGLYFLYGLGGAGPDAPRLARALCREAHNMARDGGCGVVATEVGACEPVRVGVPHWARRGPQRRGSAEEGAREARRPQARPRAVPGGAQHGAGRRVRRRGHRGGLLRARPRRGAALGVPRTSAPGVHGGGSPRGREAAGGAARADGITGERERERGG